MIRLILDYRRKARSRSASLEADVPELPAPAADGLLLPERWRAGTLDTDTIRTKDGLGDWEIQAVIEGIAEPVTRVWNG